MNLCTDSEIVKLLEKNFFLAEEVRRLKIFLSEERARNLWARHKISDLEDKKLYRSPRNARTVASAYYYQKRTAELKEKLKALSAEKGKQMKHFLHIPNTQFDLFMFGLQMQIVGTMISHDGIGCIIKLASDGTEHAYTWSVIQHIAVLNQ